MNAKNALDLIEYNILTYEQKRNYDDILSGVNTKEKLSVTPEPKQTSLPIKDEHNYGELNLTEEQAIKIANIVAKFPDEATADIHESDRSGVNEYVVNLRY